MRVWLFKDGETLPVEEQARRMRMGMLAECLRLRGHDVHWFSSTFLHMTKQLYATSDVREAVASGLTLHLLYAGGFTRNLSVQRYLFYRRYSARLSAYCAGLTPPDVIVCAFPLIEVADWVTRWGRERGIPVVVDVRDAWPDTIVDVFPPSVRPAARLALSHDFRRTRRAFQRATMLSAMSAGVLGWALKHAGRARRDSDRIYPIGYPVDTVPPASLDSPRLAPWLRTLIAEGCRLCTYVGTFGHTYDLMALVDAARILRSRDPEVHVILAGKGPRLEEVRRHAQGLTNVTVSGWLDSSEVRALLGVSSVGLLPWAGLPDAMPNKFFEYIAAGVPVIASASGELNTLIAQRDIGLALTQTAPEAWASAMTAVSHGPNLAGQAARARAVFEQSFSETRIYDHFAADVEALAAGRIEAA